MLPDRLRLTCVGARIEIRCREHEILDRLRSNFGPMEIDEGPSDLEYDVDVDAAGCIHLRGDANLDFRLRSLGELIYVLESDMIVRAQLTRPELLFLHAAALEYQGRAIVLAGRSGAGKSTMSWGLLHHGFRYLSDELAPVVLGSTRVLSFPHALCMKQDPPPDYPVPDTAWRTSRGVHVPVSGAMVSSSEGPPQLGAIFFVEYDAALRAPSVRTLGRAESAARLYPNILNALAHGNDGLAAAAAVTAPVPAFMLGAATLAASCAVVQDCLRGLWP